MLPKLLYKNDQKAKNFIFYLSKRFNLNVKILFELAKISDEKLIEYIRKNKSNLNNDKSKTLFMAKVFGENIKNIKNILDVGTENKEFLNLIEKNFPFSIANGINIDLGYCHHSEDFIELKDDCRFKIYDGKKIPFSDKIFDLVSVFSVLHHVKFAENFLNEIARVSNKYIYIKDVNLTSKKEQLFFDLQHSAFEEKNLSSPKYYTNNLNFIKKILKKNGFKLVRCDFSKKFISTFFALFKVF